MNFEMVTIRIIHIVTGTFWVGASVYIAFILTPQLNTLGIGVQGPVMRQISRITGLWLTAAAFITIVFGFFLTFRIYSGSLDDFFNTGWGWAIAIGAVTSISAFLLEGRNGVTAARMRRLYESFEGEEPTAEQSRQLDGYKARIGLLSKIDAVLVIIAVGSMAAARFV
ncbi:MAG: hypothetical protein WD208_06330 [Dehalococcoidia bacterium]